MGIDIGGSGIKGAIVDLQTGEFAGERIRIPTPEESTPFHVAGVVAEIVENFADDLGDGPIGVTFPAIVQRGVTLSVANVDQSWISARAQEILTKRVSRPVVTALTEIPQFCSSKFPTLGRSRS